MKPLITLQQPPPLCDEAAAQMLEFLHELATAFENHYAAQLRRYHQPDRPPNLDLFDNIDDQDPPF